MVQIDAILIFSEVVYAYFSPETEVRFLFYVVTNLGGINLCENY